VLDKSPARVTTPSDVRLPVFGRQFAGQTKGVPVAADDVAEALMAMQDGAKREAVRAGDVDALGLPGLSMDERELVRAAAEDDPEVAGFDWVASNSYNAFSYVYDHKTQPAPLSMPVYQRYASFLQTTFPEVHVAILCP
jgi:hypothetical protein